MLQPPFRILHLYISPGHNFFGHYGKPVGEHPTLEVPEVRCVVDRGLEGDRFFDYKNNYKGQVTFFSQEVYEELCLQLDIHDKPPGALRRNVICAGVDLNSLTAGVEFEIQGVVFRGREECRPCLWMEQSFGRGAEEALKGHGGLRAEIVRGGVLRRAEL